MFQSRLKQFCQGLISFLCEHNLLKRGCIFLHQAGAIWRGPHPVTLISIPPAVSAGGRIRSCALHPPNCSLSISLSRRRSWALFVQKSRDKENHLSAGVCRKIRRPLLDAPIFCAHASAQKSAPLFFCNYAVHAQTAKLDGPVRYQSLL
jgi:hypothetical protein